MRCVCVSVMGATRARVGSPVAHTYTYVYISHHDIHVGSIHSASYASTLLLAQAEKNVSGRKTKATHLSGGFVRVGLPHGAATLRLQYTTLNTQRACASGCAGTARGAVRTTLRLYEPTLRPQRACHMRRPACVICSRTHSPYTLPRPGRRRASTHAAASRTFLLPALLLLRL